MSFRRLILIAMLIIIVILIFKACRIREPMTNDTFILTMSEAGYGIIDKMASSGDWDFILLTYYKNQKPAVEDFDNGLDITSYHIAKRANSDTEIVFKIYKNEEDATNSFIRYENSKKLFVAHGDFSSYRSDAKNEIHRVGDNYSIFYTLDLQDDYFLVSRVENTLIVAHIEYNDLKSLNKIFNNLGYGINT